MSGTTESRFIMVQQTSSPHSPSADNDVALVPTRSAAYVPPVFPAQSAGRAPAADKVRVRTHVIHQVVVLEVAGRLSDVVDDLDRAIQSALADVPRGVVCDLSIVFEGAEAGAADMLATVGRHVRDWPGIPLAVACPDPQVREALRTHPLGAHLIVTASMLPAVSAVLAIPVPAVEWLRLAPHPTAPSASRAFVARILLDWGLGSLIPSTSLVVSELVTNSTIHAGTDIALSVEWSPGALRVTVRDNSPELPRQRFSKFDLHGRGLSVVSSLSRAFGVLPTADGGKVVWAVLNAARATPNDQPAAS
jgi:anti-sigma regulatory factor (Ser/Thr protein kinase)